VVMVLANIGGQDFIRNLGYNFPILVNYIINFEM
jgi:hypothetical protein